MGCRFSAKTAVQPLRPEDGDEDETGSKLDGRGDSAVSKVTTDSGVVMEGREVPALPGGVPRQLPPLTGVAEGEMGSCAQGDIRPKSSEILEELLNQGIIPAAGQRGSTAGEAFSIILDEEEAVRRRPPARLESLKANKTQSFSREEFDEKIRLAEERRKSKEDELKTRLRTKSARVRGPAPNPASCTDVDGHATLTPVEPILHPLSPDHQDPPLHSQIAREEAEGAEHMRETAGSDIREGGEEMGRAERREGAEEGGRSEETLRECAGRVSEADGEEDEMTLVEELKEDQLLAVSEGLENSSSPQEDRGEIF